MIGGIEETSASCEARSAPRSYPTVATGDSGCEAYAAIAWGVGLSHERSDIAEAESFYSLEGKMCGTAMRGAVALPGSKATSRAKGSYRNLGGLISDPLAMCLNGPRREGEEPTPTMYGGEKSDRAIVAMKPANKTEQSAAELVERRARAEGNAVQRYTRVGPSAGVGVPSVGLHTDR